VFPGINGFHWTLGHILFLAIFFTVLLTIGITVVLAIFRSGRDVRRHKVDTIRWHQDFEELPDNARRCRHELTGELEDRICPNAFECRACSAHPKFAPARGIQEEEIYGLRYPHQRLYHRGHTWVEPQEDGTVLVGLDEIALRMLGEPDQVELPPVGSRVQTNGSGWQMKKQSHEVRVLAPVDGEVVDTGGPDCDFYLRIKPDQPDLRHLLRGSEVRAWIGRELERLQMAFAPAGADASLADGGILMHNLIANLPDAAWDTILGDVFLEP
jgi:hypothetical protein